MSRREAERGERLVRCCVRAELEQGFGRWVDAEVARAALARDAHAEIREVTVLFTDLRGFT